jgi:sec-independent protein translocase protein TatC
LLAFSDSLKFQTQIRIADWIDFAIMLPVMFGISFQLPLVMLFLERLSIFQVKDYREKRRIAILVITILSMILTPAEPYSMVMMMMPLIFLYEMGILVCQWFPKPKPFDDDEDEEPKKVVAATT